jgi:hypothetical protein
MTTVGRNDPCTCGSDRKSKQPTELAAIEAELARKHWNARIADGSGGSR